MNLKAKRIYYIRRYKIEMLYNIIPHIKTLDSQEITMAQERNYYERLIAKDDYVFIDTVYDTDTNDYKIKFTEGDSAGYTIKWEDYEKLTLSNGTSKAVWRTTFEDVIRIHAHFNGTGPGDEVTQTIVDGCMDATRSAVWAALNVPVYATQSQKREIYKMTKMLMIRLVMLLRDFHAE